LSSFKSGGGSSGGGNFFQSSLMEGLLATGCPTHRLVFTKRHQSRKELRKTPCYGGGGGGDIFCE